MPTEEHRHELEEEIVEEHSFDVLARSLAAGTLSRQRALKLVGAVILGGALSFFALPNEAEARRHKKKKHRHTTRPPTCIPKGGICPVGCVMNPCEGCCSRACDLGKCI